MCELRRKKRDRIECKSLHSISALKEKQWKRAIDLFLCVYTYYFISGYFTVSNFQCRKKSVYIFHPMDKATLMCLDNIGNDWKKMAQREIRSKKGTPTLKRMNFALPICFCRVLLNITWIQIRLFGFGFIIFFFWLVVVLRDTYIFAFYRIIR